MLGLSAISEAALSGLASDFPIITSGFGLATSIDSVVATAAAVVSPDGVLLSSAAGDTFVFGDANLTLLGIGSTISEGTASVKIDVIVAQVGTDLFTITGIGDVDVTGTAMVYPSGTLISAGLPAVLVWSELTGFQLVSWSELTGSQLVSWSELTGSQLVSWSDVLDAQASGFVEISPVQTANYKDVIN
jgi:hypothetical protein